MADAKERQPFYERRSFKGAVALMSALTAVWAFGGAPMPWEGAVDLVSTELPHSNTEIVLDASAAMSEPFGKRTKLEAAADAIAGFVTPLNSKGLALRRTGGTCRKSGELLVDFEAGNAEEVSRVATQQQPAGSSFARRETTLTWIETSRK